MSAQGRAHPAIGETLKSLRDELGITQEELAWRAEMHVTGLSRIECGHAEPELGTFRRIAKGLGVSGAHLLELIEWCERERPEPGA